MTTAVYILIGIIIATLATLCVVDSLITKNKATTIILRRLSHEAVTWYHCKYCDAFHVGHRTDKKR